jgi:hypothetical protein
MVMRGGRSSRFQGMRSTITPLGAAPPQGAGCHKEPDHPLDGGSKPAAIGATVRFYRRAIDPRHTPVHRARRIVKRLVERSTERA